MLLETRFSRNTFRFRANRNQDETQNIGQFSEGVLTKATKRQVKEELERKIESDEVVTFHGQVREIDLDAKRFDLRHIEKDQANEVRFIYANLTDPQAVKWTNQYVAVTGVVVRDADGKARLMETSSIEKT